MRIMSLIVIVCISVLAKSDFSEPKPSFENPRRVVMKLANSDIKYVNKILSTIYNIQKEYPAESLNVVVVVYGNGMMALKKGYDKQTQKRIRSLMEYDVEFIGCINTMQTLHLTKKDFIDDIEYVQAGIVEVIERQVDGFIEATPY